MTHDVQTIDKGLLWQASPNLRVTDLRVVAQGQGPRLKGGLRSRVYGQHKVLKVIYINGRSAYEWGKVTSIDKASCVQGGDFKYKERQGAVLLSVHQVQVTHLENQKRTKILLTLQSLAYGELNLIWDAMVAYGPRSSLHMDTTQTILATKFTACTSYSSRFVKIRFLAKLLKHQVSRWVDGTTKCHQ